MKAIVLMGISCLMLAGVYGVMGKQSAVSKVLSFNQEGSAATSTGTENQEKTASTTDTTVKKSTSKTLDDSHWIEDPLFEKAAGTELVTGEESSEPLAQPKTAPATKRATPKKDKAPVTAPAPEVKQLILELDPDSTAPNKKIETISV